MKAKKFDDTEKTVYRKKMKRAPCLPGQGIRVINKELMDEDYNLYDEESAKSYGITIKPNPNRNLR